MKLLEHFLGVLCAFCLMIIFLITSVEAVAYWTPGYYEHEYSKYNVTEAVRMEMDDLLEVTDEMMAYLRGNREDLHVDTIVNGEPREFFNAREIAHMEDVRGLFIGALWLRRICLAAAAISVALLFLLKADVRRLLPRALMAGTGLFFLITAGLAALAVAAVALIVCFGLQLGPVPAVIVVLLAFVATAMSAQSVGQTGIDPMEIFGLIVLLAVAAVSSVPQVQLFFVAGIVAVACGLAGDVMNDFHAGHVLGTSPKAQWIGQAIGAVLGALVAVAVMAILVSAYGPESFGPTASFVSAQASVVATMVSGIPSVPAFAIGLAAGFVLYLLNFPAMMLGLGIYLPFYMSLTAFLGAMAKVAYDAVCKLRRKGLSPEAAAEKEKAQGETGLVVSSGLLGGESIVGVLVALAAVATGLGA